MGEEREDRAAAAGARAAGARSWRSTCARVSSISLSYCTPDGHAVTHAMQPRQLSKCARPAAESSAALLVAGAHQHDPPARRVHLLAPQHVGRARRQAEAAVHAVVDQRRARAAWRSSQPIGGHAQMPPTKSPGLQVAGGSKRSLTRRMSASAPGSTRSPRVQRASRTRRGGVEQRRTARARARARSAVDASRPRRRPRQARATTGRARRAPTTRRARVRAADAARPRCAWRGGDAHARPRRRERCAARAGAPTDGSSSSLHGLEPRSASSVSAARACAGADAPPKRTSTAPLAARPSARRARRPRAARAAQRCGARRASVAGSSLRPTAVAVRARAAGAGGRRPRRSTPERPERRRRMSLARS